jgi:hypothetical protein
VLARLFLEYLEKALEADEQSFFGGLAGSWRDAQTLGGTDLIRASAEHKILLNGMASPRQGKSWTRQGRLFGRGSRELPDGPFLKRLCTGGFPRLTS